MQDWTETQISDQYTETSLLRYGLFPELTVVGWIKILFHPSILESSSSSSSALSCLYQFDNSTLKSPRIFFKYGFLFAMLSKFSSKLTANVRRRHANEKAKDMKKQN